LSHCDTITTRSWFAWPRSYCSLN